MKPLFVCITVFQISTNLAFFANRTRNFMNKILQLYYEINKKTSSGKSLIFIERIQMPFKGGITKQNTVVTVTAVHMICDTTLPFKLRMKLVFLPK